eukprot:gene21212-23297_t
MACAVPTVAYLNMNEFHEASLPVMMDVVKDQLVETSMTLVISPLKALMMDQVAKLKQRGITGAAIYEGQSEEILDDIKNGTYSIIFASPESVLGTEHWRNIFHQIFSRKTAGNSLL